MHFFEKRGGDEIRKCEVSICFNVTDMDRTHTCTLLPYKGKRQHLLSPQVNIYCILPLQRGIVNISVLI